MRRVIITSLFILCLVRGTLAQDALPAAITVLNVSGGITYTRSEFQTALPVQAGQLILATDLITPGPDAFIQAICPNGNTAEFLATDLNSDRPLPCPVGGVIIGDPGMTSLRIQRGGRQDASIPYLITPRSTLVRIPNVTLTWNAPLNVEHFTLTVREASTIVWTSDKLPPETVVIDGIAYYDLPVALTPNTPYTVEICVLFTTLRQGCTTDPGWSASVDTAFYYVPDVDIDTQLIEFGTTFEENSAEARYARAVLLSQPVTISNGPDRPIGYYAEAITLLEALLRDTPDHPLAQSPATLNFLGELYRSVNLPLSAARAYQHGVALATPITEPATTAFMGSGMTTPAGDEVEYYTDALETSSGYFTPTAFIRHFEQTCGMIGDICLDLPQCSTVDRADCEAWHKKA